MVRDSLSLSFSDHSRLKDGPTPYSISRTQQCQKSREFKSQLAFIVLSKTKKLLSGKLLFIHTYKFQIFYKCVNNMYLNHKLVDIACTY